jgi:hypothetical protein
VVTTSFIPLLTLPEHYAATLKFFKYLEEWDVGVWSEEAMGRLKNGSDLQMSLPFSSTHFPGKIRRLGELPHILFWVLPQATTQNRSSPGAGGCALLPGPASPSMSQLGLLLRQTWHLSGKVSRGGSEGEGVAEPGDRDLRPLPAVSPETVQESPPGFLVTSSPGLCGM